MNYTPVPVRDLSDTTPEKLATELTVEELAGIDAQLRADKAELDKRRATFEAVLNEKFEGQIGSDLGTTRIEDGHYDVVVTTPKKVKWDADLVEEIETLLRDQWQEDPSDYIVTKRTVEENKYKAWPKTIQELFNPARTVSAGKRQFKFEEQH
tara:strand:- start:82 stop:540 length:459 start_codon:yes stop_codon:yes gene_type:complete